MCLPETGVPAEMDQILGHILGAHFEDLDEQTVRHAKDRVIDTVGCLAGGAFAAGNEQLVELIKGRGGRPEATILMYGGRVPASEAAMVNCILCRSYDFEPVSPVVEGRSAPGHVSGTTVMTALSLGERVGAGGRELLLAMLLGDDLTARLLSTSEFSLALGWDGNGLANALGATAIAGRLLRLSEKQLRNAFGLVLNQLSGTAQNLWEGTTAFKLPLGLAARNGVFAAELALAGWTAPKDALRGQFGYYHLFATGIRDEELLTKDLGKKFWSDMTFKPYPCCRSTHGLIDCALEILRLYRPDPSSVRRVICRVPRHAGTGFLAQPWTIGEFPQGNALFSFRYTVATALLRGSVKPAHFTEEAIRAADVNEFIKMIEVESSSSSDSPWALTVVTEDGRAYSAEVRVPKGDIPGNPLSREELLAKFRDNLSFAGKHSPSAAERLLALLDNLEMLETGEEIVRLLVP